MSVLVEDAAEAVPSVDIEPGGVWLGDRWGQCTQRPGVRDSLVRPVGVVELLELAQGVQQVRLIPDQGPVEQLAAWQRCRTHYADLGIRRTTFGIDSPLPSAGGCIEVVVFLVGVLWGPMASVKLGRG